MNSQFHHRAFTIIEVLVATAVLALFSVLLVQIVDHTMRSTGTATRRIEQAGEGRRALDVIEADLRHAIRSGGAAILVKSDLASQMDSLAFLVHGRGPSPSAAALRFLAVSYWWTATNDGTILRGYVPSSSADLLSDATAAWQTSAYPPSPIAKGIVRGLVQFEMDDGTLLGSLPSGAAVAGGSIYQGVVVPSGWNALLPAAPAGADSAPRVRALVLTVAVLDDGSRIKVGAAGVLTIRNALTLPSTPSQIHDVPGYWEQLTVSSGSPVAAQALRVFQKRIPLL